MQLLLQKTTHITNSRLAITGSKSETNRLLLLQALFPQLTLKNTSDSDDSIVMKQALSRVQEIVDVHHAGTAMRFLTAFFAVETGKTVTLTGSSRMKERPIGILVDALRQLGADIKYAGRTGFPPLHIVGGELTASKVTLEASVSSQYISALLLIAPKLKNGLELTLEGKITSVPYIRMTLALLDAIGIKTAFEGNIITVKPTAKIPEVATLTVESDWSSASYFYSIVALSGVGTRISLSSYKPGSLQGDSALAELYTTFGVETVFGDDMVHLQKTTYQPSAINFQLNNTPDIAQTIAVTCFGLGIGCHLTGLHTLRIKETDRLQALKIELGKLGAQVAVTDDSLTLEAASAINPNIAIATYNDHRMAMAFAPLALKTSILIDEAEVVSKSYPSFWADLEKLGFIISQVKA